MKEKPLQKLAQNPEKLDAISSKMTDMFMTEKSFADENDLAKLRRLVELSESDDFGEALEEILEMVCGEETPVQNLIELVKTVIGDEPIAPSSGAKGDEFVSLLDRFGKLATSLELTAAGKHSEAITNLRELHESFKTKYGEAHKITLSTRSALSDSLWEAGNKEEALQIKREVVAVEKKARGLDHPMTLRNIQLLAEWEAAMATTNMNQHPVP
ncbi:uncharacterized protein LOC118439201 [Folsomia candida]|uniref:uncharacterized protein LOC118439201 n=1 Tax=Folsomia candida TaxID=158441 RepID=UPI001605094C|nr:uncharacterized protein LOC118439201 [Folsomia candida]XP_035716205.1 uncharacterized protein LOC118439201 [Folsomia candida]